MMGEFQIIQKWLVESGNTFSCLLRGEYENDSISLISDLKCMSHVYCEVAHDKSDKLGGY